MKASRTKLKDVILFSTDIFEDHRGFYREIFNRYQFCEEMNRLGMEPPVFVQADVSVSDRHVLRGLHGDEKTWKLISCVYGRLYFVVVNPDTRQWEAFHLTETNRFQVLVPPGYGNGHLVLSDKAVFHYHQSTYYGETVQFTLKWNDPELGIWWPVKEPILSRRDSGFRSESE